MSKRWVTIQMSCIELGKEMEITTEVDDREQDDWYDRLIDHLFLDGPHGPNLQTLVDHYPSEIRAALEE